MIRYVLDAAGLVVFLSKEEGWTSVENMLEESRSGTPSVAMSAVNWGEVYGSIFRKYGPETALWRAGELSRLGIEIIAAGKAQAQLAAELKAKYKLGYADAYAAATALSYRAKLVTSDADFRAIENKIDIVWLRKPQRR